MPLLALTPGGGVGHAPVHRVNRLASFQHGIPMSEINEFLGQMVSQNILIIDLLAQIANRIDNLDSNLTRIAAQAAQQGASATPCCLPKPGNATLGDAK